MAWEARSGRYYYYRKRREGKRVISEYCGGGSMGRLAEDLDFINRAEAWQARAESEEQRAMIEAIDRDIRSVERSIGTITRAVLLVSGFHPHKNQWRKRRNAKE